VSKKLFRKRIAGSIEVDAHSPLDCVLWPVLAQEPTLKTYGFVIAIGLILGIAMVWWVEPEQAGAVFIVVATVLVCFVASVVLTSVGGLFRKTAASQKTKRVKR
jgi:hypothetical protein